jgi:hypothetical protein
MRRGVDITSDTRSMSCADLQTSEAMHHRIACGECRTTVDVANASAPGQ